MTAPSPWPALPLDSWAPTRDTFILWLQVIGKVRMARTPLVNHWWDTTLSVTSRGLTTGLVPGENGGGFSIDLDLLEHRLEVRSTAGEVRAMELAPRSVRDFHAELMGHLDSLGLATEIWPVPVELVGAIPFPEDETHASYDAAAVTAFWRMLVQTRRVFDVFRARFLGKSSPVLLYWGAMDLATARFSGRTAPPHPGGAPNCGPHVMHEAYSHEVSSAGFWPGGEGEGIFYSYAYPEPDGFRSMQLAPEGARYDETLGELVLPYTVVRTAPDPDRALLEFLQRTYEAAAICGGWDRAALER